MEYLTYETYREMGGELEQPAFHRYSYMAQKEIDRETFGRIENMAAIPEAVEMLMFELIGVNTQADVTVENITNETVGKWSRTYGEKEAGEYTAAKQALILQYLSRVCDDEGTPLLYRGCL